MKFIKQIGDGELTVKNNQVIDNRSTQEADEWTEQFSAQSQVIFGRNSKFRFFLLLRVDK